MSVYSMTGYASAQNSTATPSQNTEGKTPIGQLGLEIRSVNSRFLDLSFRLPDLLVGRLKRGKVEVRASIESNAAGSVADPSPRMLQRLNAVQDNVRAWLPAATPLSVADVVRLCAAEQTGAHDWSAEVMPVAEKALQALLGARQREGARLATMLLEHIAQLRTLAQQAVPLIPQLVEQNRQKFLARWKEAMALADGTALPEAAQDRALTEATAFAIRIDVA